MAKLLSRQRDTWFSSRHPVHVPPEQDGSLPAVAATSAARVARLQRASPSLSLSFPLYNFHVARFARKLVPGISAGPGISPTSAQSREHALPSGRGFVVSDPARLCVGSVCVGAGNSVDPMGDERRATSDEEERIRSHRRRFRAYSSIISLFFPSSLLVLFFASRFCLT